MSFYGVYDGHAGKDAAAFAASHLHMKILESKFFPDNMVESIKDAFNKTDQIFLGKVSIFLIYAIFSLGLGPDNCHWLSLITNINILLDTFMFFFLHFLAK